MSPVAQLDVGHGGVGEEGGFVGVELGFGVEGNVVVVVWRCRRRVGGGDAFDWFYAVCPHDGLVVVVDCVAVVLPLS